MTGNLPDPYFLDTNPETTQAETDTIIRRMLNLPVLYRSTPESLWSKIIGYLRSLVRLNVDDAAKQTLVNFAVGPNLDQIGAFLDVTRLPPSQSSASFQASLAAPRAVNTFIPVGTRVRSNDGNFIFELSGATIPAGALTHVTPMIGICQISGPAPNGYFAGDVSSIVDPIPFVTSITNTTITSGGADSEEDERFRARIKLAPGRLSVAGPEAAYQFWTRSADQNIDFVAIDSNEDAVLNRDLVNGWADAFFPLFKQILEEVDAEPDDTLLGESIRGLIDSLGGYAVLYPDLVLWEAYHTAPQYGVVNVYTLTNEGLPTAPLKQRIKDVLEPVRPFTDDVKVPTPIVVEFDIEVEFKIFTIEVRNAVEITENVRLALIEYLKRIGSKLPSDLESFNARHFKLGIDVVRTQIIDAVQSVGGVYNVEVVSPVSDIIIAKREWPNCLSLTVTWNGSEDG